MSIYSKTVTMDGALLKGENPLPYFKAKERGSSCNFIEPFPEEKKELYGYETGPRILPYKKQDRYSRELKPMQFKGIILENDKLKATFLPELGGRLISLWNKDQQRELLSRNPVFRPANLAIREAWFSGGIEWNVGHVGHAFHTCSSVFAAKVASEGEEFLRIYDFDRSKGVFWQIDFHLPQGAEMLYAYTKITNLNPQKTSMYWWTNIAVDQTEDLRVFSSTQEVIYIDPLGMASNQHGYGYDTMPYLPSSPNIDSSYPARITFADEYFFQNPKQKSYYEVAAYGDNHLFFDMSTDPLRYRKMFCWGTHKGGNHWQDFLSDGKTRYVEIQAGISPTQMHGTIMDECSTFQWLQGFGSTQMDAETYLCQDYATAFNAIAKKIAEVSPESDFLAKEEHFAQSVSCKPLEILHMGSGFGALELARLDSVSSSSSDVRDDYRDLLVGLPFPTSSIGAEQYPWLELLHKGVITPIEPEQIPPSWMVQDLWKPLIEKSLNTSEGRNWYALLHAGVVAYENDQREQAVAYWEESVALQPSAWAYRNLAIASKDQGNHGESIDCMRKAIALNPPDVAFAEEYLLLLRDAQKYEEAWECFSGLPESFQQYERIRITAGVVAMALGNIAFVESLFDREYAVIREGETTLSDLWFELKGRKLADQEGKAYSDEFRKRAEAMYEIPEEFDFRIVNR